MAVPSCRSSLTRHPSGDWDDFLPGDSEVLAHGRQGGKCDPLTE